MRLLAIVASLVCISTVLVAEPAKVTFRKQPTVTKADGKFVVEFAASVATDVEVAILDAKGEVVRHLAAGVLQESAPTPSTGPDAPPGIVPPLKAGSAQSLAWDGKDDYGQPVAEPATCSARVRLGMGVKLEKIVGGDPYAFWSEHSGQGDHAQWKVEGLEAKADGKVYILGHSTFYGHPVLRQYDARGNYLRTLFPPPAGKPAEEVAGWGVNVREDGTYTLRASFGWSSAVPARPALSGGNGGGGTWCGTITPTPDNGTVCLAGPPRAGNGQLTVGADGTLRKVEMVKVVDGEALPKGLAGPLYSAFSRDGKAQYVSGISAADDRGRPVAAGPWREGQVWKVDPAARKASPFFAITEQELAAGRGGIGSSDPVPFQATQGVAVDAEGHVFVCDRANKRVAVLDAEGKLVRSVPATHPDDVAVSPKSKTIYVTTRFGDYNGAGQLALLKFADWSKDETPAQVISLSKSVGKFPSCSRLAIAQDKGDVLVWVAYVTLPARVYRDAQAGLELVKDFYQSGCQQRALDLRHMMLDQKTGDAYFPDGHGFLFRIKDWKAPKFELCMLDAKTKVNASSVAIDARNRQIYTHYHHAYGALVWAMDRDHFTPVPVAGGGNQVTQQITCSWIFTGLGERGMAASPTGGLATLGVLPDKENRADNYSGPLAYFRPDLTKAPWPPLRFKGFGGKNPDSGGIRFDVRGNLYVGLRGGSGKLPSGFEKDQDYGTTLGRICKYARTGTGQGGDWFPTEPAGPDRVYDIRFGPFAQESKTSWFGVDGYGRIYYPTGLLPQVSVMDNEGNRILAFGTYGNRDSMGGLEGDLVPTKDVPLAWASSVDANDDFIYVTDILNIRLLRLAKTFAAAGICELD